MFFCKKIYISKVKLIYLFFEKLQILKFNLEKCKMEGLEKLKITNNIETLVNDSFDLFKSALSALVPVFQKTDIKWHQLEEHDEFFEFSDALFRIFVVKSLEIFADNNAIEIKEFVKYGFYHKILSDKSYISVQPKDSDSNEYAFNYLGSKDKPFDTVYCFKLDSSGKVIEQNISFLLDEVRFSFKF